MFRPDEQRAHSRDEVEFNHLSRILGGVGMRVPINEGRAGRSARAMFEAHISQRYDRPGCFGFVGWPAKKPKEGSTKNEPWPAEVQWLIYGAFARAAVANGVFLGGLEPAEGFGMACWAPAGHSPTPPAYDTMFSRLETTIAQALWVLEQSGQLDKIAGTRMAMGCGRLRGSYLFREKNSQFILDGPRAVETVYGDIPNRCGAMAKDKDPIAKKLFPPDPAVTKVSIFRQPWSHFHLPGSLPTGRGWGPGPIPPDVIEQRDITPVKLPDNAPQPFLIGLSLDFAKSSVEYGLDAHRARSVVNRILTELEDLTETIVGLYVSPRYGDGVAAVIVTEAVDADAALQAKHLAPFHSFVKSADEQLAQCRHLGLRIGLAVTLDDQACSPRLAGVSRTSSPAVEPLAQKIIDLARECHGLSKNQEPPIEVGCEVKILRLAKDGNSVNPFTWKLPVKEPAV